MNQLEVNKIRADFPILNSKINDKSLIYFDNAATTQKPQIMIDTVVNYYTKENSNTHSQHFLAEQITFKVDQTRQQILDFVKADKKIYSVVFTKNATEAINLVASSISKLLQKPSKIVLTTAEHHANLLPWQRLAKENNHDLEFIQILEDGNWDLKNIETLLDTPTKLVALNWVSNVLGVINPIQKIVDICNQNQVYSIIDATQAVPHLELDLDKVKPDFLAFSGHKIFGPTGIGVLIAKTELLDKMAAYQVGGEMVFSSSLLESTYQTGYQKFEAGTPNLAGIVGLSTSLKYLADLKSSFDIYFFEKQLYQKLRTNLKRINDLKLIADTDNKIPLISFYHPKINDYDLGVFLDLAGVATRSGRHCAEPLHTILGINSSTRASLAFYNTASEIDNFCNYLEQAISKLK